MPLRSKDKKKGSGDKQRRGGERRREGAGGGDLATLMGMGGMPGMEGTSDADLEAELLALEGKSPVKGKSGKTGKSSMLSMGEIDAMVAGIGDLEDDDDEGEEGELSDEDELLGELQSLTEGAEDTPIPADTGKSQISARPPTDSFTQPATDGTLRTIQERMDMYKSAIAAAESKGESAKCRRYKRSLESMAKLEQQAKAGRPVNLDDLPPAVAATKPPGGVAVASGSKGEEISDEDLAAWVNTTGDNQQKARAPAPTRPVPKPRGAGEEGVVMDRLRLYQQVKSEAEAAGDATKVRRYKRSIDTIEQMLKGVRAGKQVNLDELPPPIATKSQQAPQVPSPPQPQPKPRAAAAVKPPPVGADGKIDLDAPEFDEFNFSADDFASLAASFVDDRSMNVSSSGGSTIPPQPKPRPSPGSIPPQPKPRPSPSSIAPQPLPRPGLGSIPPQPKPRPSPSSTPPQPQSQGLPKPRPRPAGPPPSLTADGRIDLDSAEFDEFTLSEDDLAALAGNMMDDRAKKQKLDEEAPVAMDTTVKDGPKPASVPPRATHSLPPRLQPVSSDRQSLKALLIERKQQYQSAMTQAKKQGNMARQKEYGRMAIQFGRVLKAMEGGQEVDVSQMPGPPPGYKSSYNVDLSKFAIASPPSPPQQQVKRETPVGGSAPPPQPEGDEVNPDIPIPKNALEALEQRLAKYREGEKSAQEKGETSRVRRMGRIVKQYEQAIKATKMGKPVDYPELPAPPGYPPIPQGRAPGPTAAKPVRQVPQPVQRVPLPTQSLPSGMNKTTELGIPQKQVRSRSNPSIPSRELQLLLQRKSELQNAAQQAKAKGDKEKCLHYIRLFKGVDQMIQAAESGLPVNMQQLPPSPFQKLEATKPSDSVLSHLKPATEGDDATFDLIEAQLQKQVELCDKNAETYEKVGNIGPAQQYKNMSDNCHRELLAIKGIRTRGLAPPKFTMETRKFTIIHTHTELSSEQCEVEIVRAINVPRPSGYEEKDLNLYFELEFPWPSEEPQKATTSSSKESSMPEFGSMHKFDIDRKHSRSLQRVFKRTPVKCLLYQRRTLRRDIFIGQGLVSLEGLETHCETRVCVNLVDEKGRKPTGGKVEVVARLREPLTGRDQEETEEQWLVFQEAVAAKSVVPMPKAGQKQASQSTGLNLAALSPVKLENTTSIDVLKFEYSLVQKAIEAGHKDPATAQRGRQIQARIHGLRQRRQTDVQFEQNYTRQIARELQQEEAMEQQLMRAGRQTEAKLIQGRRKVMEKELRSLTGRK